MSFDEAVVPGFERAVLLPRLKKPSLDHELYENFRPVSNLQFLPNAIEKHKRILDYLESNKLEESLQSAYKKYYSSVAARLH